MDPEQPAARPLRRQGTAQGTASLTHFFARCLVLLLIKIELLRGSLFRYMPPRQSRAAG